MFSDGHFVVLTYHWRCHWYHTVTATGVAKTAFRYCYCRSYDLRSAFGAHCSNLLQTICPAHFSLNPVARTKVVQYIIQSEAGFYMKGVRLTAGSVQKMSVLAGS